MYEEHNLSRSTMKKRSRDLCCAPQGDYAFPLCSFTSIPPKTSISISFFHKRLTCRVSSRFPDSLTWKPIARKSTSRVLLTLPTQLSSFRHLWRFSPLQFRRRLMRYSVCARLFLAYSVEEHGVMLNFLLGLYAHTLYATLCPYPKTQDNLRLICKFCAFDSISFSFNITVTFKVPNHSYGRTVSQSFTLYFANGLPWMTCFGLQLE